MLARTIARDHKKFIIFSKIVLGHIRESRDNLLFRR
jgi:hypothetical protein